MGWILDCDSDGPMGNAERISVMAWPKATLVYGQALGHCDKSTPVFGRRNNGIGSVGGHCMVYQSVSRIQSTLRTDYGGTRGCFCRRLCVVGRRDHALDPLAGNTSEGESEVAIPIFPSEASVVFYTLVGRFTLKSPVFHPWRSSTPRSRSTLA